MNKYIDNLTLKEYKFIEKELKGVINSYKLTEEENNKKRYIELRFISLKIQKIIKKYEKKT